MKQIIIIIIPVFLLVLITGCGGSDWENVTCWMKAYDGGMRIETEITSYFSKDSLQESVFDYQYYLDKTYQPYIDQIEKGIQDDYKDIIDQRGVQLETEKRNNVIYVTLTATFSDMDYDTKEYFDMIPLDSTLEEYVSKMEDAGYDCGD